ncbi:hypothetical protein [Nocardia wallacei]|uniref:hypothetical protein n=1 Tax=Nocardia wallacei TaxID=480035 RepID=UPI002457AD76|nr:hypothetical protein [Nocardia wallacei]
MTLRDQIETVLRSWDTYETGCGAPAIIDYDCHPDTTGTVPAARDRRDIRDHLQRLHDHATAEGDSTLIERLDADIAYCDALLGTTRPFADYLHATQGCAATGWSADYLDHRRTLAIDALRDAGIAWGPATRDELAQAEGVLSTEKTAEAARQAVTDYESAVRQATGATATYEVDIETVDTDGYWAYWLDGAGQHARLRINRRGPAFTKVRARQCALHEILGHAAQYAALAQRCNTEDVPWVRLLSVHANHQVLFEGLAQALPLFVTPNDHELALRVRLDHYLQLVRAQLHLAVADGLPDAQIAETARAQVPFWTDEQITDMITDRRDNPQLRSYLWSYPAGIDWFVTLAETENAPHEQVLHAAYHAPLSPRDLAALWPDGPPIGGR